MVNFFQLVAIVLSDNTFSLLLEGPQSLFAPPILQISIFVELTTSSSKRLIVLLDHDTFTNTCLADARAYEAEGLSISVLCVPRLRVKCPTFLGSKLASTSLASSMWLCNQRTSWSALLATTVATPID